MVQLAALTKPGPFALRTIDFGSYYGIFEAGRLAAMTGQRLHVYDHAEISAVCTHPDFLGKSYATTLLQHQLGLVLNDNKIPFLHVRADNARAISIYERLGFALNGPMHFYFLERKN
jgi:predicted GNAT family acetyltransferase